MALLSKSCHGGSGLHCRKNVRIKMGRIREERAFWAHQLHVTLLNSIGAAIIQSQVAEQAVRYGSPHSLSELRRLKDILFDLEGATRALATSAVSARISLHDDVQRTIDGFRKAYPDIAIGLSFHGGKGHVPGRVARAAAVVLTEALANATKHALPTRIEVDLGLDRGSILLRVRDNGRGFDAQQVSEAREGTRTSQRCGLMIMREFAEALRGKLVVSSVPGRGTQLTLHIALEAAPSSTSTSRSSSADSRRITLRALSG